MMVVGLVELARYSGSGSPGGQRRSRLEVVYSILAVLHRLGPLRKTRLMQLVNLNTKSFSHYVDDYLVRIGAVELADDGSGERRVYRLTPRGVFLYRVLSLVLSLLDEAGPLGGGWAAALLERLPGELVEEGPGFYRLRIPCGADEVAVYVVEEPAPLLAGIGLAGVLEAPRRGQRLLVLLPRPGLWLTVGPSEGPPRAVVAGSPDPGEAARLARKALSLLGC
jgi:predicted transcriptional regulator